MDRQNRQRLMMGAAGATAGLALWLLQSAGSALPERIWLAALAFVWVFAAALLLLSGPMPLRRAAAGAGAVATAAAVLALLASLREVDPADAAARPLHWLAAFALVFVPLPFVIAAGRDGGWRDYPVLFAESWGLVVRGVAGWLFTGIVWGLIALSDALLQIVGLEFLDGLLSSDVVPWVLTGGVLGLAMAVVAELSDILSPTLILRLLRLLVVPVLLVMALFILALPVRGLSGLLGGVSVTLTLLAMVAAAATLVTAALDRTDGAAAHGPVMRRAVQALALILPVPSGLAVYALWLRVDQYGWTPERVFAALVALLGIGYALAYAGAVLRRHHWMARIRSANIGMALALAGLAALWLTPVLDANRIAAGSQLARYAAGLTPAAQLDLYALDDWGKAGAEARAALAEMAATDPELALRLAGEGDPAATAASDRAALLAALVAAMPLQPPGATATRDMLLAALSDDDLRRWTNACRGMTDDGRAGCVLAVADLWPAEPGEEAVAVLRDPSGWVEAVGLGLRGGQPVTRSVVTLDGAGIDMTSGMALLRSLQDAPAPVSAAPLNRIGRGDPAQGLLLLP